MRQLSDILTERKSKLGGWAKIGKALGGYDGQLIGKYASGSSKPSIEFATDWMKAYGENLIDLMFDDEKLSMVSEPEEPYGGVESLRAELDVYKTKLIACLEEKEKLKNFLPVGTAPELKEKKDK